MEPTRSSAIIYVWVYNYLKYILFNKMMCLSRIAAF